MCANKDCTSWFEVELFHHDEANLKQRHKYGCKLTWNHTDSLKCNMAFSGEIYFAEYSFETEMEENGTQKRINHVTKCIKTLCIYNI